MVTYTGLFLIDCIMCIILKFKPVLQDTEAENLGNIEDAFSCGRKAIPVAEQYSTYEMHENYLNELCVSCEAFPSLHTFETWCRD